MLRCDVRWLAMHWPIKNHQWSETNISYQSKRGGKKTVGFTSLCSEGWKTAAWKTKLLFKSWINYTQRVSNIRTLPLRYNHSNCHSCDCLQSCRFLQGTIHVLFTLCLGTCWLQCEHCGFVVSLVTHLQLQTSALSSTSQRECSFIKRHFFKVKKFILNKYQKFTSPCIWRGKNHTVAMN